MIKSGIRKIIFPLVIVVLVIWFLSNRNHKLPAVINHETKDKITSVNSSDLIYTKHAKCRMSCREIDESEVKEIIDRGYINYKKSDPNGSPCPTFAYEGRSHDHQLLRIVVADCEPRDKIVTVIDLETDFKCDCY